MQAHDCLVYLNVVPENACVKGIQISKTYHHLLLEDDFDSMVSFTISH